MNLEEIPPGVGRVAAGTATWLLLVLMTWQVVHVMGMFLILFLLPFTLASAVCYVYLTVRHAGRPTRVIAGAVLLTAALVWVEWTAIQAVGHLAGEMLAASRQREIYRQPGPSMLSYLLGVLLFFVGRKLSDGERARPWAALVETVAVALICPAVAHLVQRYTPPLSA